ncbi:MAG: non-heme iron oxygenase ferredoxin subunit [Dehalococcoidia bacterium]
MSDFQKVASVSDVPAGEMLLVQVDGQDVVLANVDGQIVAFGNECTHRGGPLSEGILEDGIVECPYHQGRFDVRTGEVVDEPPEEPIPTYKVQVEGEDIKVATA